MESLGNFLGIKITCSALLFTVLLRELNWWILNGCLIVHFRKLWALLSSAVGQWCRAMKLHPSQSLGNWVHSHPSDREVKWRSQEQDWEWLVHTCFVNLWALVEKRRQISPVFIHAHFWYSEPVGFLTLKHLTINKSRSRIYSSCDNLRTAVLQSDQVFGVEWVYNPSIFYLCTVWSGLFVYLHTMWSHFVH